MPDPIGHLDLFPVMPDPIGHLDLFFVMPDPFPSCPTRSGISVTWTKSRMI